MRRSFAAVRLAAALAVCAGLSFFAPHATARTSDTLPEPFDPSAMDRSANVCRDFFSYATGGYRAQHPIPPEYTEYGYIEELVDHTRDLLRTIVVDAQRNPGADGSNAQKIGDFYSSCMDTATIERSGLLPLQPELDRIAALVSPSNIPAELARLHALDVDAGFAVNPTPDIHDSSQIITEIDQGGLGLPERDYYLRTDADSHKLRNEYVSHVAKILAASGDAASAADAKAIVAFETRFARASMSLADLRDPEATYHPMDLADVASLAPHAQFKAYFARMSIAPGRINVAEPAFVRAFDATLADTPLSTWKIYLRWRLLDTYAPALPARFETENFAFRDHILNGVQAPLARWKRCVNATNTALGEAVGEQYVAAAFPPEAKAHALDMSLRIKRAYFAEMASLGWMTPATKRVAIHKLDAMGLKVGYPAKWRDYSGLTVTTGAYAANALRAQAFERSYELGWIGKPVNHGQWFMFPQTVNAYNDTQRNEIVLPAAQLQRPFYDPAIDDAANLGATGAGTVGHEMTHGFDDEGHKFDAQGNLKNWWTPRDVAQFDRRAQCVIDQFDRTVAVGSVHYQGRLVSGEAIADLGGLVIGYRALESSLAGAPHAADASGFTPEQRYFLSFAQSWTESVRPEAARTEALGDPHPLPRDRVNETVANVPGWYDAFHCPKPPRPICSIW